MLRIFDCGLQFASVRPASSLSCYGYGVSLNRVGKSGTLPDLLFNGLHGGFFAEFLDRTRLSACCVGLFIRRFTGLNSLFAYFNGFIARFSRLFAYFTGFLTYLVSLFAGFRVFLVGLFTCFTGLFTRLAALFTCFAGFLACLVSLFAGFFACFARFFRLHRDLRRLCASKLARKHSITKQAHCQRDAEYRAQELTFHECLPLLVNHVFKWLQSLYSIPLP